jgi:hypothetical protein
MYVCMYVYVYVYVCASIGDVYKLKYGFIGVVNRSQDDINTKKSIQHALKYEKHFFEHHEVFNCYIALLDHSPFIIQ